ncbi:MAG: hypothetical protein NVS9B15_02300 [Acidobacteriaceae bacterium]
MRTYRIIGLIVLALVFALFTRNNAHAIGRRAHPILAALQITAAPNSALQILAPKPGEKVTNDSVTIRYALRAAATVQSIPTFQLRLDANDVIQVADTSYTFTGLQLGSHSVTIQVVDANGTPVPNAESQVQFTIVQAQASQEVEADNETVSQASTLVADPADGSLSVLGVVGFGVLVGGALSLYRTREAESELREQRGENIK